MNELEKFWVETMVLDVQACKKIRMRAAQTIRRFYWNIGGLAVFWLYFTTSGILRQQYWYLAITLVYPVMGIVLYRIMIPSSVGIIRKMDRKIAQTYLSIRKVSEPKPQ